MKSLGIVRWWVVVLLLCGTMMWTACSTAWIKDAEQIVAVLMPATANIVGLVAALQGKNVSTAEMQAIQSAGSQAGADLQLMQSLITQYQTADTTAKAGLLSQIQVAMGAVQSNLNGILPALHIKDAATQAKITAVIGIVLAEVQSLEAIVPLVNPGASTGMMAMAAEQVKKHPPLTASEFVSSYNATMTAKTGNGELDHATSGMRIHLHEKFERWASAGLLE